MSPTRTKGKWVYAEAIPQILTRINDKAAERKLASAEEKAQKKKQAGEEKAHKAALKRERAAANQAKKIAKRKPAPEPPQQQTTFAQPQSGVQVQTTRDQSGVPIQQTIIVQQQQQSNTVPVLLNFFLLPGLGQLVQGRVITGIFLICCWIISLLSLFVIIGFLLVPACWLVAVLDAAMYKPK